MMEGHTKYLWESGRAFPLQRDEKLHLDMKVGEGFQKLGAHGLICQLLYLEKGKGCLKCQNPYLAECTRLSLFLNSF